MKSVVAGVLPAQFSLSPDGVLAGSATAVGTFNFTIRGLDGNGFAATSPYALAIVDNTPPVIGSSVSGILGNNGWYLSNASASWTVADAESAITATAGCLPTTLSSDTAGLTLTCQAISAGGTASKSVVIKRDATSPIVTFTTPAAGATYTVLSMVNANYACGDALSGVANCAGLVAPGSPIDTGSVGAKSFVVTTMDVAGNTSSAIADYQVIYVYSGFFQPIDNPPTLNQTNAGKAVPVVFSLGSNQGLAIFASGYPVSQPIACDGADPIDAIEQTVNTDANTLSYDAKTAAYTYVWKTDKSWGGTCRQLIVRLNDGTNHLANFKFK